MTADTPERPAGKTRRRRSATESLLSIVLALDAILVFFVMMAAFGLDLLPAGIVFGGGITLIVLLALTGRLLQRKWGLWLGWALQAGLIALGAILTPMYVIGAGFAAIWIYCFIVGKRLDSRNATRQGPGHDPSANTTTQE